MQSRRIIVYVIFLIFGAFTGCQKHSTDSSLALLAAARSSGQGTSSSGGYAWNVPTGIPAPAVPADNPMSDAKVKLGRYLFYDKRMSGDQTLACASCHIQAFAFADTRQTGLGSGSTKQSHPRSPQQLTNVAYNTRYTWANSTVSTLEEQAKAPMYGTTPVELGLTDPSLGTPEVIPRLIAATDVDYIGMFAEAFGGNGSDQITDLNIRRAIASFERTMLSFNSYFDQYAQSGNTSILTSAGLNAAYVFNGVGLFNNETGDCFHCHGGFNYTDQSSHAFTVNPEFPYHQNGIHSLAFYDSDAAAHVNLPNSANVAYPNGGAAYEGLYGTTLDSAHKGRFRAQSLRNVAVTHPFMHDGSFKCTSYSQTATNAPYNPSFPTGGTCGSCSPSAANYTSCVLTCMNTCTREALLAVVQNYNAGGSTGALVSDPTIVRQLGLTATEELQLVEFLMSLTDPEFLTRASLSNPEYGNPNFADHR